ncbi:hypothetical protein RO22_13690 [Halomonas sp. KHS3]|nr:hypothetical protein RO22_13690 [Halomonas sp. KHS3]
MQMVATQHASNGMARNAARWKQIHPRRLPVSRRVFFCQNTRNRRANAFLIVSGHLLEDTSDFSRHEHFRQPLWLGGILEFKITQWLFQELVIQIRQRVQRYTLGVDYDIAFSGQVTEEAHNFGCPHFSWMTAMVVSNEKANPVNVCFLSPNAHPADANRRANLI